MSPSDQSSDSSINLYKDLDYPLSEIVTQEPLPPLKVKARPFHPDRPWNENRFFDPVVIHQCPLCDSDEVVDNGSSTTCMGCEGIDRNHQYYECTCASCEEKFSHRVRGVNHWYVKDGKILKGIASYSNSESYECNRCGDEVRQECLDTRTNEKNPKYLNFIIGAKSPYKYKYKCEKCSQEVSVDRDYWSGELIDEYAWMGIPKPEPRKGPFKVYRTFGKSVGNAKAIKKLTLEE